MRQLTNYPIPPIGSLWAGRGYRLVKITAWRRNLSGGLDGLHFDLVDSLGANSWGFFDYTRGGTQPGFCPQGQLVGKTAGIRDGLEEWYDSFQRYQHPDLNPMVPE